MSDDDVRVQNEEDALQYPHVTEPVIDRLHRLATFIESGVHPWSFDICQCFAGQYSAMIGDNQTHGGTMTLARDMGLSLTVSDALCIEPEIWGPHQELARHRDEAVRALRSLANGGYAGLLSYTADRRERLGW